MASFLGSWGLPPPVRTQPYWPDSAPGGVHCTRNEERRRTLQHSRVHQYTTRRPRLCSKAELHLFRCIALQNQKCSWTRFALAVPAPTTLTCSLHHIAVTFEPSTTRLVLFSNDNAISDGGVALPEAIFGDHSTISQTAATHPRAVLTKSAFQ